MNKLKSALHSFCTLPWELHVMMLTLLVSSQFAPVTVDTVRDIYQAHAIASGTGFPLEGPQMASTVHIGPVWFYLLSIPSLLSTSWAAIAFFVFLLSGLKFYLAYYLGKQLHSSRLGLMLAVFLALPGWSGAQWIFWTHTSVLETSLLLYFIALRASIIKPAISTWLVCGLAFGLALHAHPTALPFAFLMVLALPVIKTQWTRLLWWMAGAVILFIPYLFDQAADGFPDYAAFQLYQSRELVSGGLVMLPELLYSVAVVGPKLFYQTALPAVPAAFAIALHWLLIGTILLCAALRFRTADPSLKKFLAGGVLMLLVVSTTVVLLRGRTPWHLAYAPNFVLAFCYGVLATMAFAPLKLRTTRLLVSPLVVLLSVAVTAGNAQRIYSATLQLQERVFYDVKNLQSDWGESGLESPAFWSGSHGEFLCEQAPVVLHGPYAAMIDAHVGMEAQMHCGRRDEILLGGVAPGPEYQHWVGIPATMNDALQQQPAKTIGNIYFYEPLIVAPSAHAIPLAEGDLNPPRQIFPKENEGPRQVEMRWPGDTALLISKPIGVFHTLDIIEVSCNEAAAQLLVSSNYSWLYSCDNNGISGESYWRVQYQSSPDDLMDAVLLPRRNQ